jgi:hypothetical protein
VPPRATPGDRAALERALGPELRATLRRLEELLGLRPGGWQRSALGPVFTQAAVLLESARLQVEEGMKETPSLKEAARSLGVRVETVRSRSRAWFRESYRSDGCLPTSTADR